MQYWHPNHGWQSAPVDGQTDHNLQSSQGNVAQYQQDGQYQQDSYNTTTTRSVAFQEETQPSPSDEIAQIPIVYSWTGNFSRHGQNEQRALERCAEDLGIDWISLEGRLQRPNTFPRIPVIANIRYGNNITVSYVLVEESLRQIVGIGQHQDGTRHMVSRYELSYCEIPGSNRTTRYKRLHRPEGGLGWFHSQLLLNPVRLPQFLPSQPA